MKKYILFFLQLMAYQFGNAQTADSPWSKFVPNNYRIHEKVFGDLNGDGLEDCVLVIKGTQREQFVVNRFDEKVDRNRRGVIVLFNHENGYRRIVQNNTCFSSENEDGGVYYPPELSMSIANGILYVHYAHGRYGWWKYTFRYQNNDFELIGYDSSSKRGPIILSETSINFSIRQKQFKEYADSDDEAGNSVIKEEWSAISLGEQIKLSEIQDFDDLNMYDY